MAAEVQFWTLCSYVSSPSSPPPYLPGCFPTSLTIKFRFQTRLFQGALINLALSFDSFAGCPTNTRFTSRSLSRFLNVTVLFCTWLIVLFSESFYIVRYMHVHTRAHTYTHTFPEYKPGYWLVPFIVIYFPVFSSQTASLSIVLSSHFMTACWLHWLHSWGVKGFGKSSCWEMPCAKFKACQQLLLSYRPFLCQILLVIEYTLHSRN